MGVNAFLQVISAATLECYCYHGNVIYKFILTTVGLLTCSSTQVDLPN